MDVEILAPDRIKAPCFQCREIYTWKLNSFTALMLDNINPATKKPYKEILICGECQQNKFWETEEFTLTNKLKAYIESKEIRETV